ncbi:MAG: hypothetical protein K2O18_16860 [Oscillospiraceae bacterium]|nr:hypothetical protein [Oscillospiraceae bacterium]
MLPDQDIELIEKVVGRGYRIKNLAYIHRSCSYDMTVDENNWDTGPVDLVAMLTELLEDASESDSPYLELTEFFRQSKQKTIHLHFQEIERILKDKLPWEAYCFEAFWYGESPDIVSPLWEDEGFPFSTFRLTEPEYSIAYSWTSQGFRIKPCIENPAQLYSERRKSIRLVKEFIKENGL